MVFVCRNIHTKYIITLLQPYNVDQLTSDSAGGATALLSGVKTNHGVLGLTNKAIRSRCETAKGNEVPSILHHSHSLS